MSESVSSLAVFDAVAQGRLSAADGARLLGQLERESLKPSRPAWLPKPLYVIAALVLGLVIGHLGIPRDDKS